MPRPLTQEQIDEVRRLFPNHTKPELRELTGLGLSTIDRIQARYHLRKSPEHIHAMGVKAGKASSVARGGDNSACYTPEAIAKRVEHYKKTFREEQVRRRWGIHQLTKIKVLQQPRAKCSQRSYLKKLGYVLDETNCIAYWTEETTRAVKMERDWSKKVHQYYKFKPYEDGMEIH
jgi:hypothetical protein